MADANDLLTLPEAKAAVGGASAETGRDALYERAVTAITTAIEDVAGPVLNRTITAEQQRTNGNTVRLDHWPISAFTTVAQYDAVGTSTALTAETYNTKPANGYRPHRVTQGTGIYNGTIERRATNSGANFPTDGTLLVTYTAGRYAALTDPGAQRFKLAATLTLKNTWRAFESTVITDGDYDLPFQSFPSKFLIPDAALELLGDDLRGVAPPEGKHTILIA